MSSSLIVARINLRPNIFSAMGIVNRRVDVLIESDVHDKLESRSSLVYLLAQRWELSYKDYKAYVENNGWHGEQSPSEKL